MTRFRILLFVSAAVLATAPVSPPLAAQTETEPVHLATREMSLGKVEDPRVNIDWLVSQISMSPDCKRIAYKAFRIGKPRAIVDGVEEKEYDATIQSQMGRIRFSPDSKRVVYETSRGDKQIIVVDGMEKEMPDICQGTFCFSPDSKRLAYLRKRSDWYAVVEDGKVGKEYEKIGFIGPTQFRDINPSTTRNLFFSPDGKRLAYTAHRDGRWLVVLDGKEGKEYAEIVDLQFSPDSKRLAFMARRGQMWLPVIDGVEGKEYNGYALDSLTFSSDSKRWAYTAGPGLNGTVKHFNVVDGVAEKEYDAVGKPIFSPGGKHVAYAIRVGTSPSFSYRVVLDGQPHDGGSIAFSPDGRRFAYVAGSCVVVDGVKCKSYPNHHIAELQFSPDNRRLAYIVMTGTYGDNFVVVDGQEGEVFEGHGGSPSVTISNLQWSSDSQHVAYVVRLVKGSLRETIGKRQHVVMDGKRSPEYNAVEQLAFSPDGKHLVFWAATPSGKWLIVVDGMDGKTYDAFLPGSKLIFSGPKSFYTLAVRNGEFLRVEMDIDGQQILDGANVGKAPEKRAADKKSQAPQWPQEFTNSVGMKLVLIPPGKFIMGSPKVEEGRHENEVQHEVEITKAYYLGAYPVTIGQFRQFVQGAGYKTEAEMDGQGGYGYNPTTRSFEGRKEAYTWRNVGWEQTDEHPVVNVTWNDSIAFCRWLSGREGKTYELPTEAEWEYACRAGTVTRFYNGDKDERLKDIANIADSSLKAKLDPERYKNFNFQSWDDGHPFTAPVGSFRPNGWKLYDMHGNVWQWCADWYGNYPEEFSKDPKGPDRADQRVLRGGSWHFISRDCRAAKRYGGAPNYCDVNFGFRVTWRVPPRTP